MPDSKLEHPLLCIEADMAETVFNEFASGTVGIYSAASPEGSGLNEDSGAIIPVATGAVLAVADGFGGRPGGERASRTALETLRDVLLEGNGGVRDAILTGFERANEQILEAGIGAATTLLAAEIVDNTIRTYNVGDSMVLVVGQRGKIKMRSLPHSPVGYAVESGFLDEVEAMHHEDRHYVSNMIGAPDMRIELTTSLELSPLDTVVLGTDGLWDNLHLDEVIEAVRKGPLEDVARLLVETCGNRMRAPRESMPSKPDDCTFILFRR